MRRSDRRAIRPGAVLVEAAIVIPVFLLMVLGTIDVGMAVFRYNILSQASRQGVRQAIVHGHNATSGWNGGPWGTAQVGPTTIDTSTPQVDAVSSMLSTCPQDRTAVTVVWPDSTNQVGDRVRVTVTSEYVPMISWFFGGAAISLSATSTMPIAH